MAVTAVGTPTLVRSTTSPVTGTQGSGQTWANGNVLLAFVTAAASTSVTAISTPAGWTKLPEVAEPGGTAIIRIAYYWIVSNGAVSAPAFTSTITGTGVMTCTIMELTGANTASPVLTSGSGTGTTTNAVAAPTTGSVTLTGCYAVAAACQFVTTAGTVTITYGATSGTVPSNLANDGTTSSTSHTGVGAVVGPATGAVFSGFVNFTTAGTQIAGYDIVIQPPPPVVVFQPHQYPPTRYISRAGHRRKWLPRQPAIYTPAAPIAIIQVSSTVETPTGSLPATTVVTVTLTHPTGTGNTLVACLTAGGSATAPVVSSVTLGGSADHWRAAITDDSGISIFSGAIWYDPNAASGQTSVVVTFTGGTGTGGDTYVTIYEVGAILAFDKGSDGDSGSLVTTWSSGTTSTIMQANEIFFGVSTASNAIPVVTGAGIWTTQSTGAGTWDQISGYQAVITQGTAAFSGTLPGGGGLYTALVATFYIGASSAQYTETFVVIVAVTDVNQNQVQRNQVTPVAVTGAQQRSVRKTVGTVTAVTSAVTRQILRTVITVLAIIAGVVRTTQRPLTSNVAVISVLTAMRVRMTTLAASLAVTVGQQRTIGRGFIVPVAILGAITRKITRTVTAPVATMAAVIRQMTHTFLTPTAITGTVTRSAARVLSAPVAVTASSTRMVIRVLNAAAAVTFGVLNRKLTRTVTAPLAVAAATVRVTARNLTTTVAVTGSVAIQKFKQVTLTAVTALGAATTRNISRSFQVPAAITANITRNITKTYITVIAVPGTVTRKINRGLITVTVLAGNTKNSIGKLLQTPAAIAGSHARNVGKGFTAPVAVSSTVTRSIARVVTAVFAVTAGITRMVGRSLAAPIAVAIAFTANATHGVIDVTLNTVIAVTGTITRNTNRILQTPVATPVTVTRMINRILITSAAVSSVFTAIKAKFLTLTASVAATAGISRQTGKIITGQAAVTGSLVNRVSKNVATVIAVIPAVTRRTGKTVIGVITVTGALSQIKLRNVILAATTAVTGNIQRKVMPNLKTSLIIVVGNIRSITRTIQGTLGIAGQTVRGIGRVFTAPIAVTAIVMQTKFKSVILAVSIVVSATVRRSVFKTFATPVAVTAQLIRGLFKKILTQVAVVATVVAAIPGNQYFVTLTANAAVAASVTAHAVINLKDLVFKQGVAGFQWVVSSIKKQWKT